MEALQSRTCRFGLLLCYDCKWKQRWTKPRPTVEGRINRFTEMYVDTYGEHHDHWKTYFCIEGEWPSLEEAKQMDAIIITGSVNSAYDDVPWIKQLVRQLQLYYQERIPLVGICFGCQILGMALGGRVDKNPNHPFVAKAEKVNIDPEYSRYFQGNESLVMVESHGDQVVELPTGAVRLASSETCQNEIWALRNALAIQSHPEFVAEDVIKNIIPFLLEKSLLTPKVAKTYERTLNTRKLTHSVVSDFVKRFTRDPSFVKSDEYRSLFPYQLKSMNDQSIVEGIKQSVKQLEDEQLFKGRNPKLDPETKGLIENGMEKMMNQFSTLMLKELRRAFVDYRGLKEGNDVVYDNVRSILSQAIDLEQPIKVDFAFLVEVQSVLKDLKTDKIQLTEEIRLVLKEASELIKSLEESTRLLEENTKRLRDRLVVSKT